ncbi:hypothetical protein UR09_00240 [Candidatus Nitromaritima sp. SCGC AAA799-A02]|nr:hypothetical protein UZ36_00235 [Candidatus Nitromaritima sp. SCGC AAA799-C22]KMP12749.1 hypothetical protein UR09_00240 [Candidatus Nitromaritima sp. SCGC AAA799-A02]
MNLATQNRFDRTDLFRWITASMAMLSAACVGALFFFLVRESVPVFASEGTGFLTRSDWWAGESYGALAMIFGSFMVTGLALLFVLPFALGGAVFTSEFVSPRKRLIVKSVMELLAGVPGIVYGLLGVSVLALWVKDGFALIDGNTLFTAGLLLGIMILPTVLTLSEDALRAVPGEYRDSALALGLTRVETVWRSVIPQAIPGIAGAVFLGLGRAMGETIAVMLVIGGLDKIPAPWFDVFQPGQSIPSKLGREAAEAIGSELHWNALMGMGLALFLIVMALTLTGHLFLRRAGA